MAHRQSILKLEDALAVLVARMQGRHKMPKGEKP